MNTNSRFYIDPSRNHNHPSEVELRDAPFWTDISANSGDLETLKQKTLRLLELLESTTA